MIDFDDWLQARMAADTQEAADLLRLALAEGIKTLRFASNCTSHRCHSRQSRQFMFERLRDVSLVNGT